MLNEGADEFPGLADEAFGHDVGAAHKIRLMEQLDIVEAGVFAHLNHKAYVLLVRFERGQDERFETVAKLLIRLDGAVHVPGADANDGDLQFGAEEFEHIHEDGAVVVMHLSGSEFAAPDPAYEAPAMWVERVHLRYAGCWRTALRNQHSAEIARTPPASVWLPDPGCVWG